MSLGFSQFYENNKKIIYGAISLIIIASALTLTSKFLAKKYDEYQSDKEKLIQVIKNQTDEIKKQHDDTISKLDQINTLKTEVAIISKQNQDIKNKINKFEQEHPTQEISKNQDTKKIIDDVNNWYDSKGEEKAKQIGSKINLGPSQLQGFYFDAANWHLNGPILKTELDYQKELNKSYEDKSQKDDNLIDKQSKLIDDQEKTFNLQEDRHKNDIKLQQDTEKQLSVVQKEVKIQKIEKYGAFAALLLKLLIK